MKKLILLTTLLTTGVIMMNLNTKREIKTSIVINQSTEEIWKKMVETESYGKWNPFIKSIQGDLEVGKQITVFIQPKDENGMEFKPTLLNVDKNKELRWVGRLGIKGVFDGEHYFILERLGQNKTRLLHGENFSGALAPLMWEMIKDSTTKGFIAHNEALKLLSEQSNQTAKL